MLEIIRLKQKSRISWLKWGDTPTKYFFLQLKAKHAKETIKILQLSDKSYIEDNNAILEEVFKFYIKLFIAQAVTKRVEEFDSGMRLLTRKISDVENKK